MDFKLITIIELLVIILLILILSTIQIINNKRSEKKLKRTLYEFDVAKKEALSTISFPVAVFRLQDAHIVWGNDAFFKSIAINVSKFNCSMNDIFPDFSCKWLTEGKNQYSSVLKCRDNKYIMFGNLIRPDNNEISSAFLGISYWFDVTDYEDLKESFNNSRPVGAIIAIDNLDELVKNQPDRIRNDIIENIDDLIKSWSNEYNGYVRKFDRDRYIGVFDQYNLNRLKINSFNILKDMHNIDNPNGVDASISIGFSEDCSNYSDSFQFAEIASELALTRGGDQCVIKNANNFEFFGGRGLETEKRTKVKSRVMANTLNELIKECSRVIVMGHKYCDFDSLGSAIGVCALARKNGKKYNIIVDRSKNAAIPLLEKMEVEQEYKGVFVSGKEGLDHADGHTLLVIVDTNRPEQVEDLDVLDACNRVAVIDHHRVAATYIKNAALGFVEPFASSTSELICEVIQEIGVTKDITSAEAEALLSGIALDTKNFTIRTGERTFNAASFLKSCGADTVNVKVLLQNDFKDALNKFSILNNTVLYKGVALATTKEKQATKIIIAQAADELLNISGVEAAIVVAPFGDNNVIASARSIGNVNVQIIMEKLDGGGNSAVAATEMKNITLDKAIKRIKNTIDEYMDV